jgi:uncharacterized membrane protein
MSITLTIIGMLVLATILAVVVVFLYYVAIAEALIIGTNSAVEKRRQKDNK